MYSTDIISDENQQKIKDHQYLKYVRNQYNLAGKPTPINITITIRVGKSDIQTIIRDVLNCFTFPLNCRIDFWAVVSSLTR